MKGKQLGFSHAATDNGEREKGRKGVETERETGRVNRVD